MEYRPYYLAYEWSKKGHNVRIIGSTFSHLRSSQPDSKGKVTHEEIDGIDYYWLKTPPYKGNSLSRIRNIFSFVQKLFSQKKDFLTDFAPDLVIASSTYPLDIFPARKIANDYKALLCFEVHDLWPLSPMEIGGYPKLHPYIMFLQLAEDFAYKNSDFVVSLLPKAKDHMISRGMSGNKFYYLPNGFSLEEWMKNQKPPQSHLEVLEGLKEKRKFIIGYAGGHALSNALGTLLKAAKLLSKKASIAFVLIGKGVEKENLIKMATSLGLENIIFLPPVPKKSIPGVLPYMDVLYIGWARNPLYRFGISPNKLIDYMMAAKPIIHAVDAGNDIVKEASCGFSISPEDPQQLVKAILKMEELSEEERKEMGEKGKAFVLKNHNYELLAEQFIEIASSLNK
ncbi:glycosyltransferase family 4 protein [Nafulsella turpanensis]|uniref:glycosyltransferase family 4 protein n=1 Tax=Nafulsella turpanensis TaxID=1265690 RepID=UPI00191C0168|nr:glycosyltransferase family 4 protein [Nafulsella turpanensis]